MPTVWGSQSPLSGPMGQFSVTNAGATNVATLSDSRIQVNSIILAQIMTLDATMTIIKAIAVTAGQAVFTFNSVPTGASVVVGYVIVTPVDQQF